MEGQSGNVYVTGHSYEGLSYGHDYCTVAYSRTGTPLWTNRYDDSIYNRDDVGKSIAVDPATGQVYVTGFIYNDTGLPGGATIAYSATGTALAA